MSIRALGATWRWRLLRAFASGFSAAGIGVGGHALAMSAAPRWEVFLLALPLATVVAYPLTHTRMRAWRLLTSTALMQLCVHLTCTLGAPAGAGTAAVDHGHVWPKGHAAHVDHLQGVESHAMSTAAMLAVHLLASVVAVVLLLRLERAAWRRLRAIGSCVTRGLRPAFAARLPRPGSCSLVDTVAVCVDAGHRRWLARVVGRRGPPVASCVQLVIAPAAWWSPPHSQRS